MSLCAVSSYVQSFRRRFRRLTTATITREPTGIRKIQDTLPSRAFAAGLLTALVVASTSPKAWGQEPQDPPVTSDAGREAETATSALPSVSSPEPILTSVEYPAGGEGDAVVVLRFVVGVDGSTRDVEVLLGDEPFAGAAASAALTWRFRPALRNGAPVAARIDFQVSFEQATVPVEPEPVVRSEQGAAPAPAPPPTTRGSASASKQATAEVTVQEKLAAGTQTLSRAAARQIPGAFGDPMRGVDVLPGVTPTISGLPFFYVRGAPPANTGFYFDGVRLPFLYHAFLGPSIIHPELIDAVHLHSGPAPSRYGGNAGGVVEGDMRPPSGNRTVNLSLGVFDAGGMVDTPFAGGKGRFFVAGRYSYVALAASLFSSVKADFWNYQGYVTYAVTPRDNVGVFLVGAYDLAQQQEEKWESEFHIADLRWDHSFGSATTSRVAVTVEHDSTEVPDGLSTDFRLAGRAQITHRFSEELKWETGINGSRDDYDLNVFLERAQKEIFELFPSRVDSMAGGYTELSWDVSPRVRVVPGLRVEHYSTLGDKQWAFDPRISATYRLSDTFQTTHGFGIAHQTPNWLPNIAAIRVAGLGTEGLQRAVFTTSGIEARLPNDWVGSAAVFHNAIFGVTDPFGANQSLALDVQERSLGRSYGLELSLRRSLTRRFGGILSYTLSRTTRTYDDYETVSGADRTHVVNLAGLYTLGANWRLGARAVGYSGYPGRMDGLRAPFDQSRAPFFFRADVRVERRFRLSERSYWSLVGELLNATGSPDVMRRVCFEPLGSSQKVDCRDTQVGPLMLPNVKVEAVF